MVDVHIPVTDAMPDFSGQIIDQGRLQLLESLGSGAYGKVYRALDRLSRPNKEVYYAVKCLFKPEHGSRQDDFQTREFALHKMVSGHPNIVTFRRVLSDESYVYVVLDLCPGGDLFAAITEKQVFHNNVTLIKQSFVELIDAVQYCHQKGVFHRDIKPENVLCAHDGTDIRLADFGLSTRNHISKDFGCGSSYYMSPECINKELTVGKYSTRHSDIWSLGVILTNMISGRNPWRYATTKDECFSAYLHDNDFLRQVLPISEGANTILKRIFTLNPLRRISLMELRHEILILDTFFMSEGELAEASECVQGAAKYTKNMPANQQDKPRILADSNDSSSEDSETSIDSEEIYAFDSPPDDHGFLPATASIPIPEVVHPPSTCDFVITDSTSSAEQGSESSSSGGESDGPITPATYAFDPTIEVPDLPEGESIDQSAVFPTPIKKVRLPEASAVPDITTKTSPARRTHLFRSAVNRLRGMPGSS